MYGVLNLPRSFSRFPLIYARAVIQHCLEFRRYLFHEAVHRRSRLSVGQAA
jgi:hypothetical protein